MIASLRAARVLGGWRGRPAVDTRGLADLISRVSMLMADLPQVEELDLNPVFVRTQGVAIADARVVLSTACDD